MASSGATAAFEYYRQENESDEPLPEVKRSELEELTYRFAESEWKGRHQLRETVTICKRRLGRRYWRRRLFVDQFYHWSEVKWHDYPWPSYFNEIRTRRRWTKNPELFFKTLLDCLKFFVAHKEKNPDYQPPDDFIKVIHWVKPLLDELRPVVEAQRHSKAGVVRASRSSG